MIKIVLDVRLLFRIFFCFSSVLLVFILCACRTYSSCNGELQVKRQFSLFAPNRRAPLRVTSELESHSKQQPQITSVHHYKGCRLFSQNRDDVNDLIWNAMEASGRDTWSIRLSNFFGWKCLLHIPNRDAVDVGVHLIREFNASAVRRYSPTPFLKMLLLWTTMLRFLISLMYCVHWHI